MSRLSFEQSCERLRQLELGSVVAPWSDSGGQDRMIRFAGQIIAAVRLDNVCLPHAVLSRCEFRSVSFRNADLGGARAHWNDFIKTDFRDANLSGADVRACVFDGVRFQGATLVGVDFRYCGFKQCYFAGADLTDAKFTAKAGRALQLSPEQQGVIDWQDEDGDEPSEL